MCRVSVCQREGWVSVSHAVDVCVVSRGRWVCQVFPSAAPPGAHVAVLRVCRCRCRCPRDAQQGELCVWCGVDAARCTVLRFCENVSRSCPHSPCLLALRGLPQSMAAMRSDVRKCTEEAAALLRSKQLLEQRLQEARADKVGAACAGSGGCVCGCYGVPSDACRCAQLSVLCYCCDRSCIWYRKRRSSGLKRSDVDCSVSLTRCSRTPVLWAGHPQLWAVEVGAASRYVVINFLACLLACLLERDSPLDC